jgi:hypothetical protein
MIDEVLGAALRAEFGTGQPRPTGPPLDGQLLVARPEARA